MIAELGLALLWMAAALAALQLIVGGLALRPEGQPLSGLVRPVAVMQGVLVLGAFAALVMLFVTTDLSVKLVVENSHSAKPLIFKIAGTWGNHEGSMLLWVTIMAIAGAFVALLERRLDEPTLNATLAGQAFISLGFYVFLLFASNPFARLAQPADEGQGLNPLLQDIGLAFHPPTLYVGYVGLSIAFSFAIGALVTRNVGPAFARAMRPWVLGAWIFLTLGITAGSYWAYYTLGWGGWWFWDPVENASLMPWLAATALLHSVSVLQSRDALRAWTVMLGVVAFSMSMVGTFLVRSGILTSVHAFAVDPQRGAFILALLAIDIGGALALFTLRAGTVTEGKRFAFVSREGALVFNNVMLSGILGIVLIGTLYPLMTEAYGVKVSVGAPYFNPAAAMFVFPMFVVMAVGPLLRWRRDRLTGDRSAGRLWPLALCAALALAVFVGVELVAHAISLLPALGLAAASGLFPASLLPMRGRNLRRTPLPVWGMVVAHAGIAVALFGMASESAFSVERLAALSIGEARQVGPWQVKLDGMMPVAGPNWTALEADVSTSYAGATPVVLHPRAETFTNPPGTRNESALETRWNGQLYVVLGEQAEDGRWQMRFWWKPFVPLIWIGGALVAIGGALALLGRVLSEIRRLLARGQDRVPAHEAGSMSAVSPRLAIWLPLILFGGLFALFVHGLTNPASTDVVSAFVGNPLPQFNLPAAADDRPGLATRVFQTGKPKLLNVFASWCVPCAAEAPQLATLTAAGVEVDGVAIHDRHDDLARFLSANGNPYAAIGRDDSRAVQLAIGSSGVPETYVIDGHGVIRYQHIGDIRPEDVPKLIARLKEAAGK